MISWMSGLACRWPVPGGWLCSFGCCCGSGACSLKILAGCSRRACRGQTCEARTCGSRGSDEGPSWCGSCGAPCPSPDRLSLRVGTMFLQRFLNIVSFFFQKWIFRIWFSKLIREHYVRCEYRYVTEDFLSLSIFIIRPRPGIPMCPIFIIQKILLIQVCNYTYFPIINFDKYLQVSSEFQFPNSDYSNIAIYNYSMLYQRQPIAL